MFQVSPVVNSKKLWQQFVEIRKNLKSIFFQIGE